MYHRFDASSMTGSDNDVNDDGGNNYAVNESDDGEGNNDDDDNDNGDVFSSSDDGAEGDIKNTDVIFDDTGKN